MNRYSVKTSVVLILSSVLFFYSVAWAMLTCFHHEDETGTATAVSADDLHQRHFAPSHVKHPKADIDCMGSNYHTETLAVSSAPSQVRTPTANITSQVPGFFAFQNNAEVAIENRWLWTLFDRGSTLPFSTDLPRYLSLSILRI